ncbi:MAG: methyltransferase domain-containing protein [Candidatus Hydrothermarchaeales archaeon]
MRVYFYLSGEHPTLPKAEVLATLNALGISYSILDHFEQVLALEVDGLEDVHLRLAMSHAICELAGVCDAKDGDIMEVSKSLEVEGSFAARVKRVKNYHEGLSTAQLEKMIGEVIYDKGFKVDLDNPSEVVLGILSEKFALGKIIRKVDRSQYEERRPNRRPYFKPGTMLPRNCRAIVNLTRIKKGSTFVDPFCGTGGFLIEAGLLGCKTYGFDYDQQALEGCEKNLKHYGLKNFQLEVMDSRKLGEVHPEMFDALAADLPYGISSSTHGQSLDELCSQSLKSFYETLKEGGHACVVSPAELDVPQIAEEFSFSFVEEHFERIHRSLTRRITVLKKD